MRTHDPRSHARCSGAGRAPLQRAAWTGALCLATLDVARAAPPAPRVVPQHVRSAMDAPGLGVALDSLGDGRLRHRGDGFTAIIHPDGSVDFRDRVGQGNASLFGFDVVKRELHRPREDRRDPSWVALRERAIFPMGQVPIFASVGGSFGGLSDWVLPEKHASAKREFLDATAPLRQRMAHAWQRARLEEQLTALGGQLVAIWRDPTLPLAERKRRLFLLWDECAEPVAASPSPFDVLYAAAGEAARAKIEAYVLRVAPRGSPEAYSPEELARLNRTRHSRARFEPYAEGRRPYAQRELPELESPATAPAAAAPQTSVPPVGPEPPPAAPIAVTR